jgi:CubicO group peptidase (beta-lactamase class C family)
MHRTYKTNLFKKTIILLVCFAGVSAASEAISQARHFPEGTRDVSMPATAGVRSDLLDAISNRVEKSIASGMYPGAVILVSHRGHTIYRGVFGNRRLEPDVAPMRFDTIFDIASLSKVVATTPAVMQLIERGKLELDAPVSHYWPAFAANGKSEVTIRDLLTHTSGLKSDITDPVHPNDNPSWHGENSALEQIVQLKLNNPPGTAFVYSDVNFIVLGYLVEILSGKPLDKYVSDNIFKPLNMRDTTYRPAAEIQDRIAPTEIIEKKLRWGQVHDASANAMDGVAGNAGVFSDASDLALYAQCLLDNGKLTRAKGKKKPDYLLGPLTVFKMTSVQTPVGVTEARGLGWDIDSAYTARGSFFPIRSYGHTGYTGTSLWIDPLTKTYIIILTSRTHPTLASINQIVFDRRAIANIVAASLTDITLSDQSTTGSGELSRAFARIADKKASQREPPTSRV